MDETVLADLAREGVARIVLTNRNHFRAAAKVRERTGAKVAILARGAADLKTRRSWKHAVQAGKEAAARREQELLEELREAGEEPR